MSIRIYTIAFLVYSGIAGIAIYYFYTDTSVVYQEFESLTSSLHEKRKVMAEMADSARKRSLILFQMLDAKDLFRRDELNERMSEQASRFIQAREKFETFDLSNMEKDALTFALKVVRHNSEVQSLSINLILEDKLEEAQSIIYLEALPIQDELIDSYNKIEFAIGTNSRREEAKLTEKLRSNQKTIVALTLFSLLVMGFFLYALSTYASSVEVAKRKAEKEANLAEKAKQLANEANKEKSRFLANMSHELRTPMHAIMGFSKLGLKKNGDKKTTSYFEKISVSAERLTSLLNDLLDLSKLESGSIELNSEQHDCISVLDECLIGLQPLCDEKGIQIIKFLPDSLAWKFDKKLITQVVINLMSNAIKFSPENGVIKIQLQRKNEKEKGGANESLSFAIKDQGIGMPPQELESIFDQFVQSSKSMTKAGGTGLGLAICKDIIKLHGGRIWAESPISDSDLQTDTMQVGASFEFVIPAG